MRIIAGTLGGRTFDSPGSNRTHPMSDKARGALFNILGDIKGLSVLDPFAGSGALSFEAVSRGAKLATAIEQDKLAQKTIASNIATLGLSERVVLVKATANAWFHKNKQLRFDLVLCDPPYDDLQWDLLERLSLLVKEQGLMVLSWPGGADQPRMPDFDQVKQQAYGDMQLVFYRRVR